jgi:hypothetical protein
MYKSWGNEVLLCFVKAYRLTEALGKENNPVAHTVETER